MKASYVVFGATAVLVLVGAVFFHPAAGADAPRTPARDDEVLQKLPLTAGDPHEREIKRLKAILAAHPDDLGARVALARLDIQLSRSRSDPRFLGYAQAALGTLWDVPQPPPEVMVLRATIRQSQHDFDGALVDLDRVVRLAPWDGQAWITRAVVLTVVGRYDEAGESCKPLPSVASQLVYSVCVAQIDSVTGKAGAAYDELAGAIGGARGLTPAEIEWAKSTLGEIAVRLGKDEEAETHFKDALALDPEDPYVLGAYADLLLDLGRPAEAAKLVEGRKDNDGLLLRLALAESKIGAKDADADVELLRQRYDASRLRGETVHRREEARFVLAFEDDPKRAVALAQANFKVQREPWDVRVLLMAAVAAKDPKAAAPALDFLDAHHLETPRIRALADKLRGR